MTKLVGLSSQLPCILWLKIKKPPRFSASWCANWVIKRRLFFFFLAFFSKLGEFRAGTWDWPLPAHVCFVRVCLCQGCIVVGVLLMIVSTIGGLRSIVQDASTFQFYS